MVYLYSVENDITSGKLMSVVVLSPPLFYFFFFENSNILTYIQIFSKE